ncbi:MAG: MFS transporter, partial [Gammaproteobacteria bacterium]
GFREGFVVMGTMCAAVLPPILISVLGTERAGYTSFAAIFGSLLALLYFNLIWQVRERPDFVQRESNPLVPGMRRVMRNRVFRILLAVYLVGSITGAIPGLMMPYFTKYVIQPENPDMWLGIFLFVYFGAGFLFLPVWVWAARRYEKKPVWLASFIPGFTASLSIFFFLDKGDIIPFAVLLVWAGAAFGAELFLGPSMQADVIDYDELYTGKRREAQYGALWSVITKFAVIPSMSVPLAILATVGYVPNVEQSETVQFAIRAIFGLAPASTAAIAFVIACFYPISRRVHEQIWRGIDQHARGESALDPITGHIVRPPTNRGMDEETSWYLDHYSLGELDRVARGRKGLSKRTALLSGLSLLVFCFACAGVVGEVDMSSEPGLIAVLYVVVAGVAITAFTYHLIRAMASSRIRRIDRTTIETHIDLTKELASGIELISTSPTTPAQAKQ